jgi:hypothetical protein
MEKDKAKRFESADALADALEVFLVSPAPAGSGKAAAWVLALVGAGAAGAFVAWYFLRG